MRESVSFITSFKIIFLGGKIHIILCYKICPVPLILVGYLYILRDRFEWDSSIDYCHIRSSSRQPLHI